MQNPRSVASKLCHFNHGWVLPEYELVLAETMGAQNFPLMLAPLQSTYLGMGVDAVEASTSVCVPEFDAPISCTTTRGQEVALKWAPRQCLHSSLVVSQAVEVGAWCARSSSSGIPDVQEVIVATTGKLLSGWRPFKSTDFLFMCIHSSNNVVPNAYWRRHKRYISKITSGVSDIELNKKRFKASTHHRD